MADRISFMAFLDYPDPLPDSRTIWLFKQRIAESGKAELIWSELQKQLVAMGLQVKCGTVRDLLHSLKQIPVLQKNLVARMLRLDAVEMEPGQRREMRLILDISCTKKPISITA